MRQQGRPALASERSNDRKTFKEHRRASRKPYDTILKFKIIWLFEESSG